MKYYQINNKTKLLSVSQLTDIIYDIAVEKEIDTVVDEDCIECFIEEFLPDFEYQEVDLADISQLEGLDCVETTSEQNGYPKNLRKAIVGFETWEQLEDFQEKYGLTTIELRKNYGQQLWSRIDYVLQPFDMTVGWNNTTTVYYPQTEEEFFDNEVEPLLNDCVSLEDLEELVSAKTEIWEEVEELEKGEILVWSKGWGEKYCEKAMSYHYDSKSYLIGLQ